MDLGPQSHSGEGPLGLNSIMVVYMGPFFFVCRVRGCSVLWIGFANLGFRDSGLTGQGLGFRVSGVQVLVFWGVRA